MSNWGFFCYELGVSRCREEASPGVTSATKVIPALSMDWTTWPPEFPSNFIQVLDLSLKSTVQKIALTNSNLLIAVLFSSHVFQDLEQKLSQQEHDALIVKNMKAELARFPKMERELRQLREENAYFRWKRGSLVEGHFVFFCTCYSCTICTFTFLFRVSTWGSSEGS